MHQAQEILVVTPTLGHSPWLDQTVESVVRLRNEHPNLRHVLVVPEMELDRLKTAYPELAVMSEALGTTSLYGAINTAAGLLDDWDWLTYLNDDDVLGPGFGRVVEAAVDDSADVIYGRVSYIDAEDRVLGAFPVERRPRRLACLMAAGIPPLTQQGTLVRRACFDRLEGFDPQYRLAADFDFWVRAVRAGCSFSYLPVETASFRLREGQLSVDQDRVQSEMKTIVANHLPLPGRLSKALIRTGFRLRHGPKVIARRFRSGHWRTAKVIGRGEP
jgi:hypothetical protein